MIAVILAMLRHRWRRALTIGLLATFTYGVAVAVPAYLAAADRAMIANEVAHATTSELSVTADGSLDLTHGRDDAFETTEPARLSAPWLETTFAVDINVDTADEAPGPDSTAAIPRLVYRQDYCQHVVVVAGRCPLTAREVLIDPGLAGLLHVGVGGQLPLWWAYIGAAGWVASPNEMTASVVGIYRPADESDPYWGTEGYFSTPGPVDGRVLPILTERGTIDALAHGTETQHVSALLRPGAITDSTIARTRQWVTAAMKPAADDTVSSQIRALLADVSADRETIREILPDIAGALILLGCFVLFLAVSAAVQDRGGEVGVIRLRGVTAPDRWWLGAGESVVPVIIGVPVGLAAGTLLAALAAAVTLPGRTPVGAATGGLLGAATVLLMVAATIAAHVRTLSAPVADVLRRIPARVTGWRAASAQAIVATLAVAAVVQLYVQPGPLTGVMLIAPGLVVVALGLLAGSAVLPLAGWIGRSSIGRGRLGLGLGALTLSRRPGAHLLLAVQVVALGLVGFSAANVDTASHARSEWVALALGAPRVVDVAPVAPAQLLSAVRAADPSGRYAMAAVTMPRREADDPVVLAVDAPRLAAVATWPRQDTSSAATVATRLHPAIAETAPFTGGSVRLAVDTRSYQTNFGDAHTNPEGGRVGIAATFALADHSAQATVDLGNLRLGDAIYPASVPACRAGCRLVGIEITPRAGTGLQVDATISGLDIADGSARPVPLPWTDVSRWRVSGGDSADGNGTDATGAADGAAGDAPPTVSAGPSGLDVTLPGLTDLSGGLRITLADAPRSLPAVAAGGTAPSTLRDADGGTLPVRVAGSTLAELPGLGGDGVLTDLEYLTRLSATNKSTIAGQVWMAADAPASITAGLAAAGLVIVNDRTSASELSYLNHQGPATGVDFEITAAAAGVLLAAAGIALMAGVERDGRSVELRSLRTQGLRMSSVRRAALAGHVGLVGLAAAAGCVVAAVSWWLTGERLPVFTDGSHPELPASAAPWWTLVAATLAGAAVLGLSAYAAALDLRRRVRAGR